MTLTEKLKVARNYLGKDQKEMADATETSHRTWQAYEQGERFPSGKVFESLTKLGFNANWFFSDDPDVPMMLHGAELEDHKEMVRAVLGDKEASARRDEKIKDVGQLMRSARHRFEDIVKQHKLDSLPEPATEREKLLVSAISGMRELFKAEIFGRISAEHKAEEYAAKQAAEKVTDTVNVQELLNMTAEVLVSNTLYRPALAANIKAFHRSIALEHDNRQLMNELRR
ncbi:MAG: helix-turn-helix domain-containing protein [Thermodesulfobacteriota bacterium]